MTSDKKRRHWAKRAKNTNNHEYDSIVFRLFDILRIVVFFVLLLVMIGVWMSLLMNL